MTKNCIYLTVSFCFFLQIYTCCGQEFIFENISKAQNFPSAETYNIIQDSKGFMWIGTENGLVKFSKNNKKIFDKQNGLFENSVYYIGEKPNNEIELITSGNRYVVLKNDSICENHISKNINNALKKMEINDIAYFINRNDKGEMFFNSQLKSFKIEDKNFENLEGTFKKDPNSYIVINIGEKSNYFFKNKTISGIKSSGSWINLPVFITSGDKEKKINLKFSKHSRIDWRNKLFNINNLTFFCLHDRLLKIDRNLNVKTIKLPAAITSLHLTKNDGLWVGTITNGVFHFPDLNNLSKFETGLKGLTVSGIVLDREGGLWCSTTEKGVFYCSDYRVKRISLPNEYYKKTTFLKSLNSKLFFSTEVDNFYVLENNKLLKKKLISTGSSELTDIIYFKNNLYLSTKGYFGKLDQNYNLKEIIYYILPNKFQAGKGNLSVYQIDKSADQLYTLQPLTLFKIDGKKSYTIFPRFKSKSKCFKIINDNLAYIGSVDGLYEINFKKQTSLKINGINSIVSKIIQTNDGKILVATRGQGLFQLLNGKINNINIGKANYILNDIVEDSRGNIWLSARNVILKLNKKLNWISQFDKSNGIFSNDIGSLAILNDSLFFSTADGLGVFPVDADLKNFNHPNIYLNSILVHEKPFKYNSKEIFLSNNQNSIVFNFDVITFKNSSNEKIIYKLKGHSGNFRQSFSNQISFDNLPPNKYELIVYAENGDGLKSVEPLIIPFTIKPAFWQRKEFSVFIITAIGIIIFGVIQKVIRNVKAKEEEKTRIQKLISESQMKALQSQMNPHFIFNAINSIQNFILNKKENEAYDYLVRFSKLIRMVLQNSNESWISIENELEILNIYIELEQLRFPDSFEYILKIDENIDTYSTEVPTMILQIFIENAIWHGIMNLNSVRKGILKLELLKNDNNLKIIVEDNGIGREKSKEFQKYDYKKSLGMKLVEERIKLANEKDQFTLTSVNIIDLYDMLNNPIGTKVELNITTQKN